MKNCLQGNWLRLVLGCLVVGMAVASSGAAPVRVALWATTLNADSEKYLDVAVAELTARGGIELVERQAIRRVLDEQSQALQQDASGVAVGKLLRADVIGVLETTPDGKEAGGFAVLDTAAGVSYWNQGLESSGVEDVAREIVRGVTAALEKHGRAGLLSTVCMLGARNAEFPRNMDVFCEMVAYLLDRRLVENPSVTTLDRRRLETVIAENRLPGVEDKSGALLPSLRLVELDFRRGASEEEIKVLARVTDAGGALIAQPEVTGPKDAVALVEKLQAALAGVLHTTPQAARGDRAAEANRFRTQGRVLRDRGLWDSAAQSFHAAYALHPGTTEQLKEYVNQLVTYASSLAGRGLYAQAIEVGQGVLDIEGRHQVRHHDMGENASDKLLQALRRCKRGIPPADSMWEEFERLRLRYLAEMGLTGIPGDPSGLKAGSSGLGAVGRVMAFYPVAFSEQLRFPVGAALTLCLTADEFFRLLDARLGPWLEREADPAQPHDAGIITTLDNLCGRIYRYVWDSHGWIPFDDDYVRGMRDIAARFQAHPRKILQLEGTYFEYLIDREVAARYHGAWPPEKVREAAKKMVEAALAVADSPDPLPPGDVQYVYEMAARGAMIPHEALASEDRKQACYEELLRVAHSMFDHKLVVGGVLKTMIWGGEADFERCRLPVLRRLQKARADRSFTWMDILRKEVNEFLKMLPSENATAGAAVSAQVLWATPEPRNWRIHLVGLAVKDDKYLYGYVGVPPPAYPNRGTPIEIQRIDLDTGRMETIGTVAPRTCWAEHIPNSGYRRGGCEGPFVGDAAFTGGMLWLATSGDGLFGVPLDGVGEPIRIGMADGLPSDEIHSVAAVGDVLYIGCGVRETEGYLAAYHLKDKRCTVLASTMRASPETPLDSLTGGFQIVKIVPDAPRQRLLLVLNNGDLQPATGLWEYRLDTARFRQIFSCHRPARYVDVAGDGKLWVFSYCRNEWRPIREKGGWFGGIDFEPARDLARLMFVNKNKQAGPYLPVLSITQVRGDISHASAVAGDGWIYHFADKLVAGEKTVELRRLSLATGEVQSIAGVPMRPNVFYWGRLKWLPQRRVLLVGNGSQIFAVKVDN